MMISLAGEALGSCAPATKPVTPPPKILAKIVGWLCWGNRVIKIDFIGVSLDLSMKKAVKM